jgi:hypothetical protein
MIFNNMNTSGLKDIVKMLMRSDSTLIRSE